MNVGDYVRVKQHRSLMKDKKYIITSRATPNCVYIKAVEAHWGAPHYLMDHYELEPWVEPTPEPKRILPINVITIGFLTQVHWFFGYTKEEAIAKWLEAEDENALPPHVEIHEGIIENGHTVAYSGPYGVRNED